MKERLLENNEISLALKQCDELCSKARQQLEESKVKIYIIHMFMFIRVSSCSNMPTI